MLLPHYRWHVIQPKAAILTLMRRKESFMLRMYKRCMHALLLFDNYKSYECLRRTSVCTRHIDGRKHIILSSNNFPIYYSASHTFLS